MASIAQTSIYQPTDGFLDQGLPFLSLYLEKMLHRPIIITDNPGRIQYSDLPGFPTKVDDMFIKLPPSITQDEYCYYPMVKRLYYHFGSKETGIYVIVKDLPLEMVSQSISILAEAKQLVNSYLDNHTRRIFNKDKFQRELADYLFHNSNAHIEDIVRLSEKEIDIAKPYIVEIIEIDETDQQVDWEAIRAYTCEHLKSLKLDIISIASSNCLIVIIPACFKKDTLMKAPRWPWQNIINKYKDVIENNFNIVTSKGIGQAYPFLDLHRSYFEARLTLILSRLLGKKNFVQWFSELGVFTLIFSQDLDHLKNYYRKTLESLIEYDDATDGELLSTLRILLTSSMNWKQTAETLFVHVNTLHYRVERIEKLLSIDLSQMETRLNLFTAIKVWDSLKVLGSLD